MARFRRLKVKRAQELCISVWPAKILAFSPAKEQVSAPGLGFASPLAVGLRIPGAFTATRPAFLPADSLQPGFGLEPAAFPLPRVSSQALKAGREQLGGGTKVSHQPVLPLSAWAGCLPTRLAILCRSPRFGAAGEEGLSSEAGLATGKEARPRRAAPCPNRSAMAVLGPLPAARGAWHRHPSRPRRHFPWRQPSISAASSRGSCVGHSCNMAQAMPAAHRGAQRPQPGSRLIRKGCSRVNGPTRSSVI